MKSATCSSWFDLFRFLSKQLIFKLMVFSAALVALSACDFIPISSSFYQKLTVTLEVDGRHVTGSSVTKVTLTRTRQTIAGAGERGAFAKGEAVTIDLGKGYYVFALLGDPKRQFVASRIALETFRDLLPKRDGDIENTYWKRQEALIEILPKLRASSSPASEPFFVTFSDINKPETVRVIPTHDMLEVFPEGVFKSLGLVDITLELVDEQPLTEKLDDVLVWLDKKEWAWLIPPNKEIPVSQRSIEQRISIRDFKDPRR